jgi:hypothetical protein
MLNRLFRRCRRAAAPSPPSDWKARNEALIVRLRRQGVAIGSGCVIFTDQFSLEPCLVEIGDRVAIAARFASVGDVIEAVRSRATATGGPAADAGAAS